MIAIATIIPTAAGKDEPPRNVAAVGKGRQQEREESVVTEVNILRGTGTVSTRDEVPVQVEAGCNQRCVRRYLWHHEQ
jgi:hypothetical protein